MITPDIKCKLNRSDIKLPFNIVTKEQLINFLIEDLEEQKKKLSVIKYLSTQHDECFKNMDLQVKDLLS